MGWRFKWASSYDTDFNYDCHVSSTREERVKGRMQYNCREKNFAVEELPGASVFHKDATGAIFHTYSCYARGLYLLIGACNWLDLVPKGRDQDGLSHTMFWVRHRDRYDEGDHHG